jgi:hypothetical protein
VLYKKKITSKIKEKRPVKITTNDLTRLGHNMQTTLSGSIRAVNGTILAVYPTHIVPDKMGMGKILFLLYHWVWVWVRKKFR